MSHRHVPERPLPLPDVLGADQVENLISTGGQPGRAHLGGRPRGPAGNRPKCGALFLVTGQI